MAATDQARRRIERDPHDDVKQRLVSLASELRQARTAVPPGAGELEERLESAVSEVTGLLEEVTPRRRLRRAMFRGGRHSP